ncbi:YncE family protein [Alienimonas sp. DA493]|uniref:YncE family protein n=1 Tax=Alienimonas sp. DA493 TaxID=3373605 RepID=UPI00375533C9
MSQFSHEPGADAAWLSAGRGMPPALSWGFFTDAPLIALGVAREGGRTLAADAGGGLYLLDPAGRIEHLQRGLKDLSALAFADSGAAAAAAFGADTLGWIEPDLKVKWRQSMPATITAVAVDPHGRHAAVALSNGDVTVYTNRRKKLARFTALRPLDHLRFLATRPLLVGAADRGLIASYDLRGRQELDVKTWANCGDLAVTGDGTRMAVAAFNLGVQRFDGEGRVRDTLSTGGSPAKVALAFRGWGPLAVATLEHELFRLNAAGEVDWAAPAPGAIAGLALDAPGRQMTVGFETGRVVRLEFFTDG